MNWVWIYVGIALVAAVGTVLLRRVVPQNATKERIGAGLSILVGLLLLAIYTQESEDVFSLVCGVVCIVGGIQALEISRLSNRIRKLEDTLDGPGSATSDS